MRASDLVLSLSLALSLLLSGCNGAEGQGSGDECVINLQCHADSFCLDGLCVQRFDGGLLDAGVDSAVATCPLGQTRCDNECANLQSDARHCGACGVVCGVSQVCTAGTCADRCVPTTPRLEVCDGADNDCDGRTDPGCDPGLVVWYAFDETGATVTDGSGNGHNATISGPAVQTTGGHSGGGLVLNGSGGSASAPGHADFALPSAFTVEAWIRSDTCSSTSHFGIAAIEERVVLGLRNGDCRIHNFMHSESTWKASKPAFAATEGVWMHIALVWDGTNLQSYANGNPVGTPTAASGPPTFRPLEALFVGDRPNCSSCPWQFDGVVDEFKLWNVARTQIQLCASAGGSAGEGFCIMGG